MKSLRSKMAYACEHETGKRLAAASSVAVPKVLPIYMTSVFSFDDVPSLDAVYEKKTEGYIYTRDGHPGIDAAAEMIALAENGEKAVCFSSGMAAIINTIMANVKAGDHIVASPVIYGDMFNYFKLELPKYGVDVSFVSFEDMDEMNKAFRPNTKVVYTETICNPLMEVVDIQAVAEMAHRHGCKLIIDNSFASPAICRPLELGADIVVESATKYLGGHSDITGGIACGRDECIAPVFQNFVRYGAIMGPFESWLLMRSLRTLDLRMKEHSANGIKVAEYLEKHPKIERVYYPGLASSRYKALADRQFEMGRCGGMLGIDVAGGEEGACKLIAELENIKFVPSLASYCTTLTYPGKTSHRFLTEEERADAGISMGLLRISVGIEDVDDIIADFDQALSKL